MTASKDMNRGSASGPAKYLTFTLGSESYGIAALKVREIIRPTDITTVPGMPTFILGVINLRGKIIPIVDLRLKFRFPAVSNRERACIIVVDLATPGGGITAMGLNVDAVEEVVAIIPSEIEPTPNLGTSIDTSYLLGIAKVHGVVKMLIDIDQLLVVETLACAAVESGVAQ